jgi:hypothetical protein
MLANRIAEHDGDRAMTVRFVSDLDGANFRKRCARSTPGKRAASMKTQPGFIAAHAQRIASFRLPR